LLKNVNIFLTLKNVKQAAYVAPEQTPQTPVVPEPETETVTVTVEIYPGAAAGEVSAADVATKLGVADLAAAIADGSVTYVGLNADGTVYTAEDGSTPSSTTKGTGHWYNSECNPIVWGTPDPAGTGAVRLAYLEGDGATYTLGYDNSGAFAAGDSYTLAGKYIYGDAEVVFEVVINVVEAPASEFVAPEADYTIDIQVVQDNAWGATYVSLTGASISGRGAYSDPAKYVTPIADWSQDITPTIEAALGIEADGLEDALVSGAVVMGAYNNMNEFQDCYEVHSSNSFFWFAAEGSAEPSYGGMACIDQLSVTAESANLTASTCLMPNGAVIGETYPTYIIFKTDDVEYVVLVNQTAVAAPEKVAMPEYTIVKEYEKTYEVAGALNHTTPDPVFTVQDIMPDIETLIEGTPDVFLFNAYDENLEPIFQDWSDTDGWFGADGATTWGGGSATFCLKPVADGTFSYCAPRNDGAAEGNIIIRYGNSTSVKAVDVKVKVIMSE